MTSLLSAVFVALAACCGVMTAAPFRPLDAGQFRTDFTSNWAGYSTVHGKALPSGFTDIPTNDPGHGMAVYTTTARIWNAPGRNQSGVLLDNVGPDMVFLYPGRDVQGASVVIETTEPGPVTYTIYIYNGMGIHYGGQQVTMPDGRVPAYLAIIDPGTGIGIIGVTSSNGNRFTISNLAVQDKKVIQIDADALPSAGQAIQVVKPLETYLHQGYGNPQADEPTSAATSERDNVMDLQKEFPGLRPGDLLAMERLGSPVGARSSGSNPLLGVLSASQELLAGTEFRRVPGAVKAGTDFYTGPIPGRGGILTPTNLQEDFIIGERSLLVYPVNARFLFLSRAQQDPGTTPMSVRVSHIPRPIFEAWVNDNGLAGTLAHPGSDLDGDGLTLLEEYAFGKDPTVSDASARADYSFAPSVDADSGKVGTLQLLYGARTDGPIRYTAEVSPDLGTWERLPPSAIRTVLTDGNAGRAVFSVIDPTSGPKRFGRLVLDFIPPSK